LTYDNLAGTFAVQLVGQLERAASLSRHIDLLPFLRLELPVHVRIFRMCQQLIRGHLLSNTLGYIAMMLLVEIR